MLRYHKQNLNKKGNGITGSIFRTGRVFIYPTAKTKDCISIEWSFFPKRNFCLLGFNVGLGTHDNALSFYFHLLGINLYATWENYSVACWIQEKTKRKNEEYGTGREIGISLIDKSFQVNLWQDPMLLYSSTDPKWRSFIINVPEILFGRYKYESKTIASETVPIPLPEGNYMAEINIKNDTWKRSRWPFTKRIFRAHAEMKKPIPIPGKGESEWDCGEDAIYASTFPADDIPTAVSSIVHDVLKKRQEYGGKNWRPKSLGEKNG